MRKSVEYVVVLADDVRKRHVHETKRGRVVRFMVQLELRQGLEWHPVIRYDNAHGCAHRDMYLPNGRVAKEPLDLGFDTAMTYGDWDINENWEMYIGRFKQEK